MTPIGQRIISTVQLLCLLCVSVSLCFTLRADQKYTVPVWSKEVQRNWVRAHSDPAIWVANVERINDRLLSVFKTTGATKTLSMQHFWKWVGQVYWAKKFLIPYFHEMNSTDDAFQDCRSLLAVEGLGARSVSYVSETDDKIKFVQILSELLESDKRKFERYINLAVAVALVWDEPFPDSWPPPNVNRSDLPIGGLDP